jgi:hypothetical protein
MLKSQQTALFGEERLKDISGLTELALHLFSARGNFSNQPARAFTVSKRTTLCWRNNSISEGLFVVFTPPHVSYF